MINMCAHTSTNVQNFINCLYELLLPLVKQEPKQNFYDMRRGEYLYPLDSRNFGISMSKVARVDFYELRANAGVWACRHPNLIHFGWEKLHTNVHMYIRDYLLMPFTLTDQTSWLACQPLDTGCCCWQRCRCAAATAVQIVERFKCLAAWQLACLVACSVACIGSSGKRHSLKIQCLTSHLL